MDFQINKKHFTFMYFKELLNNKSIKPKEKTEILSQWILENPGEISHLCNFAINSKDTHKASCLEAMEYASKQNPNISTSEWLEFATVSLTDKAPRIKWEAARVIGNIAPCYPAMLENAINNLLINSEHEGTVVRWSTAYALGEILKLKTDFNDIIIKAIEKIVENEEKNSIRKIYLSAFKQLKTKR